MILLLNNIPLGDAVFTSAAALNNVGASFGSTASDWGTLAPMAKLSMTVLMLLGRLEIFTLIALFSPWIWRQGTLEGV
jgi:trk system potassium uptake protein TrkH